MKKINWFFETPKRAAVSASCIAAAAFLGAGTVFAAGVFAKQNSVSKEKQAAVKAAAPVTLDEAVAAALQDAGLGSGEVTVTKAKRDTDDGIFVYDVEFSAGNTEYEYEIYEDTGAVYSKSKETVVVQSGGTGVQEQADGSVQREDGGQAPQDTASQVSLEEAKAIALNHAGFQASEIHFSKAKFEKEHGSVVYELEFYKDGAEYEYTIDAATGEVLEFDSDMDD